jgi:hypothetical protein
MKVGVMLTLTLLLLVLALFATIGAGINRAPLWVAVLLIVLALLLGHVPIR